MPFTATIALVPLAVSQLATDVGLAGSETSSTAMPMPPSATYA